MPYKTLLLVAALAIAACGSDAGDDQAAADTTTTLASATTVETEAPAETTSSTTTTTAGETTTTAGSTPTTAMRGEPIDMGPPAGAVLGVIGVNHDDVLNLRENPGADQRIVAEIPPTADDVVAQGRTRTLPDFWTAVSHGGTEGWVNMSFLAYLGSTDDITSQVVEDIGRPTAETMAELGRAVAESLASEDPPSDIVMVIDESTDGDLGEVTFDVVGLGDDSVRGVRLHVFGEPNNGGFTLRTVEQTLLCDPVRGVTDDGLCT